MFPCVFPAQPGFFALVNCEGQTLHLPVIGWYMADEFGVRPVTVECVEDEDTVVIGPDGKKAHR